jgi:hypothetical protein
MIDEVSNSKRMKKHKNGDFSQPQNYMLGQVLTDCRMAFRIRCELVKDIKGNYKDKFKRLGGEDALKCDDCLKGNIGIK